MHQYWDHPRLVTRSEDFLWHLSMHLCFYELLWAYSQNLKLCLFSSKICKIQFFRDSDVTVTSNERLLVLVLVLMERRDSYLSSGTKIIRIGFTAKIKGRDGNHPLRCSGRRGLTNILVLKRTIMQNLLIIHFSEIAIFFLIILMKRTQRACSFYFCSSSSW